MNISDIDAVVLCGGRGTRLEAVQKELPKALVEIGGKPFLRIFLEYLKKQNLRRIVLCVGYKAELIEKYVKADPMGLDIIFSKETKALGTAGAVLRAKPLIQSEKFLVFNGDSLCQAPLAKFAEFHQRKKALASIVISRMDDQTDFGTVVIDAENRITGFLEKERRSDGPAYVNAGIYCFNQEIFRLMPERFPSSLEFDVFPLLIENNMYGFPINSAFLDIGTPQRYKEAQEKIKDFFNG